MDFECRKNMIDDLQFLIDNYPQSNYYYKYRLAELKSIDPKTKLYWLKSKFGSLDTTTDSFERIEGWFEQCEKDKKYMEEMKKMKNYCLSCENEISHEYIMCYKCSSIQKNESKKLRSLHSKKCKTCDKKIDSLYDMCYTCKFK